MELEHVQDNQIQDPRQTTPTAGACTVEIVSIRRQGLFWVVRLRGNNDRPHFEVSCDIAVLQDFKLFQQKAASQRGVWITHACVQIAANPWKCGQLWRTAVAEGFNAGAKETAQ
jgi:hypothetical protein